MSSIGFNRESESNCLYCPFKRPQYNLGETPLTQSSKIALCRAQDALCSANKCNDKDIRCGDIGTYKSQSEKRPRNIISLEDLITMAKSKFGLSQNFQVDFSKAAIKTTPR